jgi:hypothetical protein
MMDYFYRNPKYHERLDYEYRKWLDYMQKRYEKFPLIIHTPIPPPHLPQISVLEIFNNLDSIVPKEERLQVNKIYLGSPGIISLKGLGEPIKNFAN